MIISAYEAQATAISVYNDARNRTRFMPIFSAVVGLYSTLMISSGVIGYVRFGDAVKGNWVANMPNTPTLAVIKIMYSIAVFMTYPVMCVVRTVSWLAPQMNIVSGLIVFPSKTAVQRTECTRRGSRVLSISGVKTVPLLPTTLCDIRRWFYRVSLPIYSRSLEIFVLWLGA